MITDNQWHDGVLITDPAGGFLLLDNLEDGRREAEIFGWEGEIKYQDVRYNWNRGQPIVDFGQFQASIVDTTIQSPS
jgi:hypothetical protein